MGPLSVHKLTAHFSSVVKSCQSPEVSTVPITPLCRAVRACLLSGVAAFCVIETRTAFAATRSREHRRGSCETKYPPRPAVREYEQFLAMRSDRRKRRRGRAAAVQIVAQADEEDGASGEAEFFDAEEPALRKQANEEKPCGIDKAFSLSRRGYGGLLVATLPCGRVCAQAALAGGESLTQVCFCPPCLRTVVAAWSSCSMTTHAPWRVMSGMSFVRTETAGRLAELTYVLDSFREANHTACLDPQHASFLPEVRRSQHPQLDGVNSQTAEQFFARMDPFVRSLTNMAPRTFRCVVLLLAHWYNLRVCGNVPPRRRPHRRGTGGRPSGAKGELPGPALAIALC